MSPENERPGGTTRRTFLAATAALAAAATLPRSASAQPATTRSSRPRRYPISACDWIMLKRHRPGAITLARDIGLDGVEVDMGGLGDRPTFDSHFGEQEFKDVYLQTMKDCNVLASSVAMSGFYAQDFAHREGVVERMLPDTIAVAEILSTKTIFLPMGVRSDLVAKPELRPIILERLKATAKVVEAAGMVLGVETAYGAADDMKLLDEIGSPAVKNYFNVASCLDGGRDVSTELKLLGKDRIAMIHATDRDGLLLRDNKRFDIRKMRDTLEQIGWTGWLTLERSRDAGKSRDTRYNFGANAATLREIFD